MTEYLIAFFETLNALTQRSAFDVPHAIAWDGKSLCVLVSMGDVRAKVPVEELDPNPAKAAELIVAKWKAMDRNELDASMEGVR